MTRLIPICVTFMALACTNGLYSQFYSLQHIAIFDSILVQDSAHIGTIDLAPQFINSVLQNPLDTAQFPGGGLLITGQISGYVHQSNHNPLIGASLECGVFSDTSGNQYFTTWVTYHKSVQDTHKEDNLFEIETLALFPSFVEIGDTGRLVFSNIILPTPSDSTQEIGLNALQVLEQRANDSIYMIGPNPSSDSIYTYNIPFVVSSPSKRLRWYGFAFLPEHLPIPILSNDSSLIGTAQYGVWSRSPVIGSSAFAALSIPLNGGNKVSLWKIIIIGALLIGLLFLKGDTPCEPVPDPPLPDTIPANPGPPLSILTFDQKVLFRDTGLVLTWKVMNPIPEELRFNIVRQGGDLSPSTYIDDYSILRIRNEHYTGFEFKDNNPISGLNTYAAFEIDRNGQRQFSFQTSAMWEENISRWVIIYPTYAKKTTWIAYKGIEKMRIRLFDPNGNLVAQQDVVARSPNLRSSYPLDLSHLRDGLYFVWVQSEELNWKFKLKKTNQ